MLNRLEARLVEERRLADQKRVLELTLAHDEEKATNREVIAKALADLGRVIGALPPAQRREVLQLLVSRVVVKPWKGEPPGISGGSIAIAPEIGTKRYSVKISISESSSLSKEFTNFVDGSIFEKTGCPGWDRTSDQVINSQKKSVSADVFHCLHLPSLTRCFSEGTMCRKLWTISRR